MGCIYLLYCDPKCLSSYHPSQLRPSSRTLQTWPYSRNQELAHGTVQGLQDFISSLPDSALIGKCYVLLVVKYFEFMPEWDITPATFFIS